MNTIIVTIVGAIVIGAIVIVQTRRLSSAFGRLETQFVRLMESPYKVGLRYISEGYLVTRYNSADGRFDVQVNRFTGVIKVTDGWPAHDEDKVFTGNLLNDYDLIQELDKRASSSRTRR